MSSRILAIINPISGTGSKAEIPQLIAKAYNESHSEVFITYTKNAGHGYELAKKAVEDNYDIVIAVGGDGTINEIARALTNSNTVLAIVPCGSGNGLARSLNIPMAQSKAISNIEKGKIINIDTCQINGIPFFCTAGMGFDAEVAQRFEEATTRGPITYAINMIREYISFKPTKYRITIDDKETFTKEAFVIAIANADQYGNDAYIAPEASLTDGYLDLVILESFNTLEMPRVVIQLFTKKINDNVHQTSIKARKIIIEREKDGYIHIDGNPKEMSKRLEITINPKSLKVVIPSNIDSQDI